MATNYVLLMGLFLLLVAVDCSSSDPKGNVNEENGLDQNVDDIVDPVNGKNVLKSASDSIEANKVNVKANERDQIDKSGIESGTSKSNLNQQSGSNEGENLQKDGQESSAEAKAKTDGKNEGDNMPEGQGESNVEAKGKMDGENEGDNVHNKSQEESNVEAKGKMDGETEGDNVHKDHEKSNVEAKGKADGGKKENLGDSVDPKELTVKKDNAQDSVPPPPPTRTDGFRGEECDPSNMCMDKNERFAACLRVPGNESPDLSLLIQNKGKGPLTIKISAPAFVQLEETDVELQEKQDKKVKVSIKDSGTGNLIVLKDGRGECSLDFKDLIVHNSAESYVNFLSQTPTTTLIFVAAILILASGWMCMSFKRRQLARSGLKYQRLDMELPVSAGAKTEPDVNDGWDNSWGNNWEDEEAPMTPLMPVTPSLSSKGLASRRLSKEGWKD
ncbi:PREDICTED: uncharacterized protein LOC18606692 isoform X1 [Theobroma cacao]|uniref:Uncharacterized protein LOC18606692 isoform X1 n=1 Tax=Theobroma cacao TaxID=3641 RepID=A0AB32VGZ5_THECC|nr:PREDICTED: uncharacterized protein LOC18606692 isoform X1 [Theobroma cacao]